MSLPSSGPPTFGPVVDTAWLRNHLDDVVLCDVRWYLDGRSGRTAYAAGHLPGAVFVDLDVDLSDPPRRSGGRHPLPSPERFATTMSRLGVGDDARVVAYDDAGGAIAARLWWMLDAVGVDAAVLDGGIDAWSGPLEHDIRNRPPAHFTPRPWPPERFVDADRVDARPEATVLLDARPGPRYRGEPNHIDPRFGHIPGARSRPFADNLTDGHFLAAEDLAAAMRDLGIDDDNEVIASCGSGVTACHDLLALRLAGLGSGALYVGSWSEWGADPDRPIETG